jgi:hypothetical protein
MIPIPTADLSAEQTCPRYSVYLDFLSVKLVVSLLAAMLLSGASFLLAEAIQITDSGIAFPISRKSVVNGSLFSVRFRNIRPSAPASLTLRGPRSSSMIFQCSIDINSVPNAIRIPFQPGDVSAVIPADHLSELRNVIDAHFQVLSHEPIDFGSLSVALESSHSIPILTITRISLSIVFAVLAMFLFMNAISHSYGQILFLLYGLMALVFGLSDERGGLRDIQISTLVSAVIFLSLREHSSLVGFGISILAYPFVSQVAGEEHSLLLGFLVSGWIVEAVLMVVRCMSDEIVKSTVMVLALAVVTVFFAFLGWGESQPSPNQMLFYVNSSLFAIALAIFWWPAEKLKEYELFGKEDEVKQDNTSLLD